MMQIMKYMNVIYATSNLIIMFQSYFI